MSNRKRKDFTLEERVEALKLLEKLSQVQARRNRSGWSGFGRTKFSSMFLQSTIFTDSPS